MPPSPAPSSFAAPANATCCLHTGAGDETGDGSTPVPPPATGSRCWRPAARPARCTRRCRPRHVQRRRLGREQGPCCLHTGAGDETKDGSTPAPPPATGSRCWRPAARPARCTRRCRPRYVQRRRLGREQGRMRGHVRAKQASLQGGWHVRHLRLCKLTTYDTHDCTRARVSLRLTCVGSTTKLTP